MKIAIVYRENDAYRNWMLSVMESLEDLGHEIVLNKAFLADTEYEEIDSWWKENKVELEKTTILTDRTYHKKGAINIDYIFESATARTVAGSGFVTCLDGNYLYPHNDGQMYLRKFYIPGLDLKEEIRDYKNKAKEAFCAIIKNIAQTHRPENVYIYPTYMADHAPFDKSIETEEAAAETVKGWLIDAGIDEGSVSVLERCGYEKVDKEGNWIIFDRHYRNREIKNALDLSIPLESLLYCCIRKNLATVDEAKFREHLKSSLKLALAS